MHPTVQIAEYGTVRHARCVMMLQVQISALCVAHGIETSCPEAARSRRRRDQIAVSRARLCQRRSGSVPVRSVPDSGLAEVT